MTDDELSEMFVCDLLLTLIAIVLVLVIFHGGREDE